MNWNWFKRSLVVAIASCGVLAYELPTLPAEKISFNYGLLGFNIKVADLELFAKEGEVTRHLGFYLQRISPEKREQLREFLQQTYQVDPVLLYRYSRTAVGKKMLLRIGKIIQIPQDINGFYALRGALVQAASNPEGINFIEFLKYFPTDVELNLEELLALVKQISNSQTAITELIDRLQSSSSTTNSFSKDSYQNLSTSGKLKTSKQTLELYDKQRDRTLVTDLYLPQTNSNSIPVIVVSNGLGAKRDRFTDLAKHLTSYGFAVAVPDHPGSDRQRQRDFVRGLYEQNFDATEFIDRPQDISFILDRLKELPGDRLDLQNVGIFGYSIGGATALSLAGAELNFKQLQEDCQQPLNLLNISILYQCRALETSPQVRSLRDSRIKAVYLFVPFGKSLFGRQELSKITIPVMWQAVDRDFLTSLLTEQIPAFNALDNSRDRYFVVSEKLPHTTATLPQKRSQKHEDTAQIAKNYQNILSLVFFKAFIDRDPKYQAYLNADFLQAISQQPYQLHLVDSLFIDEADATDDSLTNGQRQREKSPSRDPLTLN